MELESVIYIDKSNSGKCCAQMAPKLLEAQL